MSPETILVAKVAFWVSLGLVLYPYVLYPLVLFLTYSVTQAWRDLRYLGSPRNRRTETPAPSGLPGVSIIIPAYNEEKVLLAKIDNLHELDFPRERLQVIFVSDGSEDGTNQILQNLTDENYQCILLTERKGKANALNQAVARATNEILVFCDAGTLFELDAIKKLVRHFSDPEVGAVCGAVRYEAGSDARQTEGAYWKYESALRMMEARLGAILNASGCIYALRRECFSPIPQSTILEDFVIPMRARRLGFSVLYDPEAVAIEFPASTVSGEFTRRVRLAVGSFRALGDLVRVPWRGFTPFALISHKLLRWLVPFFAITLFISNVFLMRSPSYRVALAAQVLFYCWAGLGFFFYQHMRRVRYGLVPYFLFAMHLAFIVGFFRCLVGADRAVWQKVS
ncbi:MAG TPA: glycosyltransferase family 2 protein [Terriglobales bacterium]|jgi:cellulose synthase/poly-beta-1,6-N-acetylglucosamine synthase-like glycosyltransferase|nr:glycosyltransferase family 2 protein [Terriglobales bacterium]